MTDPITPDQVAQAKKDALPDEVIQEVNRLIGKNWSGHSATIKQDEIVAAVASRLDVPRQKVFDELWLNFEDVYRKVGWEVKYDKPAYNESYPATFEFRRKR